MKKHIHIFWLLVSWLAFQSFFLFVDGWFTHDSRPGNFRVGFPSPPTEIKKDFHFGNSVFSASSTSCKFKKEEQSAETIFEITWFDHPFHSSSGLSFQKLNLVLDSAQSYFFSSQHLLLNEIKEMNLGGSNFFGREYNYLSKDSSVVICNHVFLVQNRFFILNTTAPTKNTSTPDKEKFLNSFTFLDVSLLNGTKKP